MRVVIYCRRETDLAQLKQEGTQLYAYALQAGYQIDSMILDLDCGIWLERAGSYELLRQLQHNKGDAVLLNNMIALGSTISVQQRALAMLQGYPLLLADMDSRPALCYNLNHTV